MANYNSVPFDPGYSKHITSFMYFYEQIKAELKQFKTLQQRAFKYKMYLNKILEILKKEVGFYYGCLLWASYIKNENPPKIISENSFLDQPFEDLEKYDYLMEVKYLLKFFKEYQREMSYYNVKHNSTIDEKYIKIVEIYKKFLEINKSFIATKTTDDLLLPDKIKTLNPNDLIEIKRLIDLTITDGDFERLFEFNLLKNS